LHGEGDDFAAAVQLRDRTRAVVLDRCREPDLENERIKIARKPDQSG